MLIYVYIVFCIKEKFSNLRFAKQFLSVSKKLRRLQEYINYTGLSNKKVIIKFQRIDGLILKIFVIFFSCLHVRNIYILQQKIHLLGNKLGLMMINLSLHKIFNLKEIQLNLWSKNLSFAIRFFFFIDFKVYLFLVKRLTFSIKFFSGSKELRNNQKA